MPNITHSQIFERLDKLAKLKKQLAEETDLYVLIARRNGISWDRIGLALGYQSKNPGNALRIKYGHKAYRTVDIPRATKKRPKRTHCIHGHRLTETNSYKHPSGVIRCRVCKKQDDKGYRNRRKAKVPSA